MPILRSKRVLTGDIALLAFGSLIVLQACSKSPIGVELAKSFDVPQEKISEVSISKKQKRDKPSLSLANDELKSTSKLLVGANTRHVSKSNIQKTMTFKKEEVESLVTSFKPQPYRITIKLSGANPSAPAETVTQALRLAGVSFEVEKIERIESKSYDQINPTMRGR